MKQNNQKKLFSKLTKWLDQRFRDIEEKIDHILFRLRYEDPRIYEKNNGNNCQNEENDDLEMEEEFIDI